ncbi:unnamed protein product [Sphagnum jensenii]|uniref:Uncharacterized protein n=1 Tax=Sphagnum jensenii TaxID=128206 RepID=A0ABP0W6E7_9BRYO
METCSTTLISRTCSIGRIVETAAAYIDLQGINVIEPPPRPAWMASGRRDDGEAICSSRRECVVTLKAPGVLINTFYDPEPRNIDVLQTTLYGGSDSNGQGHLLRILPMGPMLPPAYFTPAASNLWSSNGGPAATTAQKTQLQDHPTTDLEPCLQWLWKQLPASAHACLAPPLNNTLTTAPPGINLKKTIVAASSNNL